MLISKFIRSSFPLGKEMVVVLGRLSSLISEKYKISTVNYKCLHHILKENEIKRLN